jgi:hypothetical protein
MVSPEFAHIFSWPRPLFSNIIKAGRYGFLADVFARGADMGRKIMIGIIVASISALFGMIIMYHLDSYIIRSNNRSLCVEYNLIYGREIISQAELYLVVQHNAYPGVKVLWPVNVGPNSIPNGFRAIPFTAQKGDVLKFSLLDDNHFTDQEEKLFIDVAGTADSVIVECANACFILHHGRPLPRGATPTNQNLLQLGAREVIQISKDHPWKPLGWKNYIVQEAIPDDPNAANSITISSAWGLLRRINIKVYQTKIREI